MKQTFTDEKTGISYNLQGDYYIPDHALPTEEERPISVWGQRYLRYIREHMKVLYTNLLTSGKLNTYLADIDKQAQGMFFRLVRQMSEKLGVTEQLKVENQLEWISRMNNIRNAVEEIVNADLIYE